MSIQTTRDQVLQFLQSPDTFLNSIINFINETKCVKEYKISRKIISFMGMNAQKFQFRKDSDMFIMNYKPYFIKVFEIFNVKWTQKSSLVYFDKENFHKTLLAMCEYDGTSLLDERLFQLKHYVHNFKWEDLKEQLYFLLTLREKVSLRENYTSASKLYSYAIEMLQENDTERVNGTLQVLYDVLSTLKYLTQLKNIYIYIMYSPLPSKNDNLHPRRLPAD